MKDENGNYTLPGFFTIIYFADVGTSLLAIIMWGDFPDGNIYMISLINSALYWILFKVIVYFIIMCVFLYMRKFSTYAENILTAVTVIYAILMLNHLSSITMQFPVFNISPEFYRSIDAAQYNIIP